MTTGRGIVLAAVLCASALAQERMREASEQELLVAATHELEERAQAIHEAPGNSLAETTESIVRAARWLANNAAKWSPARPGEGRLLLRSIDRILQALRSLPSSGAERSALLTDIRADLAIKEEHCRTRGLVAPQRVFVVTKRNGVDEVKGLAVLYIEKFFASDPTAKPLEFRGFSSPAVDDLAPGRYIVWAQETAGEKRAGPRKEARIGNGVPKEPIEVLTP